MVLILVIAASALTWLPSAVFATDWRRPGSHREAVEGPRNTSKSPSSDNSDRIARNAIIDRYNDKIAESDAAVRAGNYREAARLRRQALREHEGLGETKASRTARSNAKMYEEYADAQDAANAGDAAAKSGNYARALKFYRTMILNPGFDNKNNRKIIAETEALIVWHEATTAADYRRAMAMQPGIFTQDNVRYVEKLEAQEKYERERPKREAQARYVESVDASKKGNAAAEAGNYAQAIEYYRKMMLYPRANTDNNKKVIADVEARLRAEQELQAGATPESSPGSLPTPSSSQIALGDGKMVRNATSRGEEPPFQPLWNSYSYNRTVGRNLVPDENRCAIIMSMTLGFEPRSGEASLQQLKDKSAAQRLVQTLESRTRREELFRQQQLEPKTLPEVKNAEIGKRYYISAQQLADRVRQEWGQPKELSGKDARGFIEGKKGIIFLQNAYETLTIRGYNRTGDHIDLWDTNHIATNSTTPFEKAEKVWFWEIRQ